MFLVFFFTAALYDLTICEKYIQPDYYNELCNQQYLKNSTENHFCQFFLNSKNDESLNFQDFYEYQKCMSLNLQIYWNGHTTKVVNNLLNNMKNNFCKNSFPLEVDQCNHILIKLLPMINNGLTKLLSIGAFCDIILHNVNTKRILWPINELFLNIFASSDPIHYMKFIFKINLYLNNYHPLISFENLLKSQKEVRNFNFFNSLNNNSSNKNKSEVVCHFCETVSIKTLPKILNDWKKHNYLEICTPDFDKYECENIVDTLIEHYHYILKNPLLKYIICNEIYHCNESKMDSEFQLNVVPTRLIKNENTEEYFMCVICKVFSKVMYNITQEPYFQTKAMNNFKLNICPVVFSTYDECNRFMKTQYAKRLAIMTDKIKNAKLCALNCNTRVDFILPRNNDNSLVSSNDADICDHMSYLTLEILMSLHYKIQIQTDFEKVICDDEIVKKNECTNFMNMQFLGLVENVIEGVNHGDLCNSPIKKSIIIKEQNCDFCLYVLGYIQFNMFVDKTKSIDTIMGNVCNAFDILPQLKCLQFMKFSRFQIKALVLKKMSKESICFNINQCT